MDTVYRIAFCSTMNLILVPVNYFVCSVVHIVYVLCTFTIYRKEEPQL